MGRRKRSGDFFLYDGQGRLLLHQVGLFFIFVNGTDPYKTLEFVLQHMHVSTEPATLADASGRYLEDGSDWAAERQERLSAWVQARVAGVGGGDQDVAFPRIARMQEEGRVDALLATVSKRLKAVVEVAKHNADEDGSLSGEEARDLVQWASGLDAEASALARAVVRLAQEEKQHNGGKPYVLRVLEVSWKFARRQRLAECRVQHRLTHSCMTSIVCR